MMAKRMTRISNVPMYIAGLLLVYAILKSWTLTSHIYAQVFVSVVGCCYLIWRSTQGDNLGRVWRIITALVLVFVIFGFNSTEESKTVFLEIDCAFFLGLCFLGIGYLAFNRDLHFDWLDNFVLAAILVLLAFNFYSFTESFLGGSFVVLKFILALVVWLVFAANISPHKNSTKLSYFIFGSLGLICLVGAVRIGIMFYHLSAADDFRARSQFDQALEHYLQAQELAERLAFQAIKQSTSFIRASILVEQGHSEVASQILGLEKEFVKKINFQEWNGPAGGNLYTNLSCWREIALYPGCVEISIFAKGTPALGEWPIMKVKLGNLLADKVEVSSQEIKPYVFVFDTTAYQGILSISFINDSYIPPEDRNLWIDRAEIRYKTLYWK
jgi:hypothetical protein